MCCWPACLPFSVFWNLILLEFTIFLGISSSFTRSLLPLVSHVNLIQWANTVHKFNMKLERDQHWSPHDHRGNMLHCVVWISIHLWESLIVAKYSCFYAEIKLNCLQPISFSHSSFFLLRITHTHTHTYCWLYVCILWLWYFFLENQQKFWYLNRTLFVLYEE